MNTGDNIEIVLNETPADNLEDKEIRGEQLLKLMDPDISDFSQEEIFQQISESLTELELPGTELVAITESLRLLSNLNSLILASQLKEDKDTVKLDRLVSGFTNFVENFETAEPLEGM